MAFTAVDEDEGRIVFTAEATGTAEYTCPDCTQPAEFVRSHLRNQNGEKVRVRAHFRYPNCKCYGKEPSASENPAGGGGGGGGESELHKRRKSAALAEALHRFPNAEYSTEEYTIGEKRADAALIFDEPHQEYGKGLAIEYQHKNESKDLGETETHFAKREFTTVWLWEDQFSFTTTIPDINLFGGRVYTPWPDAVPPTDAWRDRGMNAQLRKKWSRAKQNGLVKYGSDAILPKEWCDEKAQDVWNGQRWYNIVQKHSTGLSEFTDSDVWHAEEYIEDVRPKSPDADVPARLPNEWYEKQSQRLFRNQGWNELFRHSEVPRYMLQIALCGPTTRNESVSLPPTYTDDLIYKSSEWHKLFKPGYSHGHERDSVEIDISFAQFFPPEFWKEPFLNGVEKTSKNKKELERPPTGFDDVQCHECGRYNYWENAGKRCSCGIEYDWEWNVLTGRISENAIPESVDLAFE